MRHHHGRRHFARAVAVLLSAVFLYCGVGATAVWAAFATASGGEDLSMTGPGIISLPAEAPRGLGGTAEIPSAGGTNAASGGSANTGRGSGAVSQGGMAASSTGNAGSADPGTPGTDVPPEESVPKDASSAGDAGETTTDGASATEIADADLASKGKTDEEVSENAEEDKDDEEESNTKLWLLIGLIAAAVAVIVIVIVSRSRKAKQSPQTPLSSPYDVQNTDTSSGYEETRPERIGPSFGQDDDYPIPDMQPTEPQGNSLQDSGRGILDVTPTEPQVDIQGGGYGSYIASIEPPHQGNIQQGFAAGGQQQQAFVVAGAEIQPHVPDSGAQQMQRGNPAAESAPRFALSCVGGYMDGRIYPIGNEPMRIGRGEGNVIRYPDKWKAVSRKHAEVYWNNGKLMLRDSCSQQVTGTFVEHQGGSVQRMNANTPVTLAPGDAFYIGEQTNKFQVISQ